MARPKKVYVPKRGDVVFTDFDPAAGHEQQMRRPALVLSPEAFNGQIGLSLVVPITSRIREHGFEVVLTGTKTTGVALCHQVKVVDFSARGVNFVEKAPKPVVDEALAKVRLLVT